MKTLAAIPCYNEALSIGSVVLKARRHVDTNFLEKSLIKNKPLVVDDGSSDGTAEVAQAAGAGGGAGGGRHLYYERNSK